MKTALGILLLSLVGLNPATAASFADTDGLLIEYDFRSDGPVNDDPTPLVRVYGSGRLMVAVPYYRKNAGFYEGQLSPTELEDLLTGFEVSGVLGLERFEVDAARAAARAKLADDVFFHRSETETTRMAFSLAGAKSMKESVWTNLRSDHERYAKHASEFSVLWDADRALYGLTRHHSLQRVRGDAVPGGYAR